MPGAVRPDAGDQLTLPRLERNTLERLAAAVALPQLDRLEQRRRVGSHARRGYLRSGIHAACPERRVLFIGDVVGEPGRRAIERTLPGLIERHSPDLVITNGENVAGGLGITERTARKLLDAGTDVITTGNHVYRHSEVYEFLDRSDRIVRPANYLETNPGRGYVVFEKDGVRWGVVNL